MACPGSRGSGVSITRGASNLMPVDLSRNTNGMLAIDEQIIPFARLADGMEINS